MKKEMVFLVLSIILISFVSAESIDVPSGLTAYWNFEGNGNNYLKDVAPSGQGIASDDAVDKDSATISLGRIGESSIELDGDKDYLEIASSEDVAPTDEISISGWFKLKSMGVGSKVITGSYISKRDSYILGPGDDGKISNTVDGGIRWNEKKVGVQDLFSVHFVDENNGWAAGREGIIYKTTDDFNGDWIYVLCRCYGCMVFFRQRHRGG